MSRDNEYLQCIYKMMYTLTKRCVKAITQETVDHQKFAALIGKQYGILTKIEEERNIQFKISESLNELAQLLGLMSEKSLIMTTTNRENLEISRTQQNQKLQKLNRNTVPLKSQSVEQQKIIQKTEVKIVEQSLNVPKNQFFVQRKSVQTEIIAQQHKTLEQKEREFLQRFK